MKLGTEYLAGLFDGEGCIHIAKVLHNVTKRPSYGVRAIICLTQQEPIRIIAEQFGVSYCRLSRNKANPKWRDAYQVQITGEAARKFLLSVMPFLLIKREEAVLAVMLQDHINKYRAKFYRMTPQEKADIDEFRENIKRQITLLKRADASNGMTVNSGETQNGQSRAKQTVLSTVGRV